MKLADKVVVITGAGSGIGRATALAVAAERARVIACDLDQGRLDALGRDLGDRALLLRRVDVSSRTEMAAFADEVHALVPAADVLVNNAGVGLGGTFLETRLDDWAWVIGINLFGVVHGCHYFIPAMVKRGQGGQVINLSSILGIYSAPNASAYVASKFAVRGLSQSLRSELAQHGIGVTAICPGLIATSIIEDGRLSGTLEANRSRVSGTFRKGASPEMVARTILEAIAKNPAVKTSGRDAAVLSTLTRLAPTMMLRLGNSVAKRLGGAH